MSWSAATLVLLFGLTSSVLALPAVRVSLPKDTFDYGETLHITVTNEGPDPVTYSQGPRCGVHLEFNDGERWRRQAVCFDCYSEIGSAPCTHRTLAPGASEE